jgi:hypothetical protein
MAGRITVVRVLLSGFVLTVTATTAMIGVGVAAASPTPAPARQGSRLEALVVDQSDPVRLQPVPRVARPAPTTAPARKAPAAHVVKAPSARAHAVTRTTRPKPVARHSTSLNEAVARIPGYSAHRRARWVLTGRYGHWGATDLANGTVYISPSVPASRLDSVVRHEWAHVLQIRVYGSAAATVAGLNAAFGGSGMTGVERAADCMALQLGATWTNYTSCSSPAWQRAAARLLAGRRP